MSRKVSFVLHPRGWVGVGAAVVALAVAGCGGGDDDGASSAPVKKAAPAARTQAPAQAQAPAKSLSRAEYIRQADKVCLLARGVSRRANEVVQKAFSSGSAEQAAQAIDNYVPLFAEHQETLKALPRPRRDRKVLDGLIKVMDGQIQALRDESVALRQQDSDAMAQITKAQQDEVRYAEDLGHQYGFRVCGRTSGLKAAS